MNKKWRQDPSWLQTFFFFILHGQFLNKERGDFWRNYSRDVFFAFSPEANSLWPLRCERSDALSAKFKANLVMSKIAYFFFIFVHVKNCPFVKTQCIKFIEKSHLKIVAKNSVSRRIVLLLKIQSRIPCFWSNSMIS